jgi:hypothetical protein
MFSVLVRNGKPGCLVRISGGERPVVTRIGANGTAWVTVDAGYRARKARVVARTIRCRARERASTRVVMTRGRVHGPSRARHRAPVHLDLSQWSPRHRISVVAVNGRTVKRFTVRPDRRGMAGVRLALDKRGTWAVVIRQHGASAHTRLRVH